CLVQIASFRQKIQQQMKVNEPSVAIPAGQDSPDSLVIERVGQTQPTLKIIACANVIAWKNVGPPQTAQQDILRGPAPYAAKFAKAPYRLVIGERRQRFQVQLIRGDRLSKLDYGPALL